MDVQDERDNGGTARLNDTIFGFGPTLSLSLTRPALYSERMPVVRHFLGWDRPLVEAVRDFIIPEPPAAPVDLEDTLILVPTRQAGRRLTDTLALYCAAADTALLSCQVVTPSVLLKAPSTRRVASPLDVQAGWITVLAHADPGELPGLFPTAPPDQDAEWALRFAAMIETLRHTLLEAGTTISELVTTRADDLVELERWQDLATLEAAYLNELATLSLLDPCQHQLAATGNPDLDERIARIIVAAIPDPNAPARRVLAQVASRTQVDILIAAPESFAATFDAWGRPLVETWRQQTIDIPAPETHIVLTASPADQAARAIDLLQAQSTDGKHAALGTPDRGLVPHLQAAIQQRGGAAFDPADKPLRDHPLYHLVAAWTNLATDHSYTALSRLLRQPALMTHLDHTQPGRSATVLKQLDDLQNERLPWDLAAVNHWLRAEDAPPALKQAVALINTHLPKADDALSPALRSFLQTIMEHRTITAGRPEDDEFEHAARAIDDALHELAEAETRTSLPLRSKAMMLMRRLGEAHYHREREKDAIDILGWLELAWNPAPQLIIAGINEGAVPTAPAPDAFLTDSLRATLGIRSDADILARDAFLLQGIIASRRHRGATWLLAGKVSDTGDPLRPSRLLFRCNDADLPARAAHLFRDVTSPRRRPATTSCFPLAPGRPGVSAAPIAVSVTAFRDYLGCPFRFYLKRVLGMETQDDAKRAPDALDFGNLIHFALQRMGENPALQSSTDAHEIADFLSAQAQRWIERQYGRAPALPIRMALHAAQQRLEAAAHIQAGLTTEGWQITAVEQPFSAMIGGLTIRGKIDRIDRHRDSGTVRVIDYKTSDTASDPVKAHLAGVRDDTPDYARVTVAGKAKRWTDLQLPLYAMLAFDDAETPPEPAYFSLPRAVSETSLQPWKTFDADLAAEAYEAATAIATRIHDGRFWPPAERVDYDDFEAIFHDGLDGWKELTT